MHSDPQRPPGTRRRLTRSSRERMWAGVSGGLAEYFEVDPVLVRLIWVAGAILTGGLAVPLYIVLWIIMPRDTEVDQRLDGEAFSAEFGTETRRFAEQAKRLADDLAEQVQSGWRAGAGGIGDAPEASAAGSSSSAASYSRPEEVLADETREPVGSATGKAEGRGAPPPPPPPPARRSDWDAPWGAPASGATNGSRLGFAAEDVSPASHEGSDNRRRGAGLILVVIGLVALAGQMGLFRVIPWNLLWPLVLVGIGVALLLRSNGRWKR